MIRGRRVEKEYSVQKSADFSCNQNEALNTKISGGEVYVIAICEWSVFPFPTNCNIIWFLKVVQVLKEVHYFRDVSYKALAGPLTLKVGGNPWHVASFALFWIHPDLEKLKEDNEHFSGYFKQWK